MAGHPEFLKLLDQMRELHLKKTADYGSDADPLHNLHASEDIGVPAEKGCWMRAKDKVKRIDQFYLKGSLKNESVEDSLLDLATYCLLGLVLRRERMAAVAGEGEHWRYDRLHKQPKSDNLVGQHLPVADKGKLCDTCGQNPHTPECYAKRVQDILDEQYPPGGVRTNRTD